MKKRNFTMSEILITLGIIGIVAAMTIPSLMYNIGNKIKAHKIETFNKKFSNAMDLLNIENGIGPYYGEDNDSTLRFVDRLSKHLKIIRICNSDHLTDCFNYQKLTLWDGAEHDISDIKNGEDLRLPKDASNDYSGNNVGIILADGTSMILNFNRKCQMSDPDSRNTNSTSCVGGIYDINGANGPNTFGEDIMAFNDAGCPIEVGNVCYTYPKVAPKISISECKEILGEYCFSDSDSYAGAVKACGGRNNMPTLTELERSSLTYEKLKLTQTKTVLANSLITTKNGMVYVYFHSDGRKSQASNDRTAGVNYICKKTFK